MVPIRLVPRVPRCVVLRNPDNFVVNLVVVKQPKAYITAGATGENLITLDTVSYTSLPEKLQKKSEKCN